MYNLAIAALRTMSPHVDILQEKKMTTFLFKEKKVGIKKHISPLF